MLILSNQIRKKRTEVRRLGQISSSPYTGGASFGGPNLGGKRDNSKVDDKNVISSREGVWIASRSPWVPSPTLLCCLWAGCTSIETCHQGGGRENRKERGAQWKMTARPFLESTNQPRITQLRGGQSTEREGCLCPEFTEGGKVLPVFHIPIG